MDRKTLAIFSSDKRVKDYLVKTIREVIENKVGIKSYSLDEGITPVNDDILVMTSGDFMTPIAKRIFPQGKIIAAKRLITGYNLEKVIMLPKGKKVLVVNHPRVTSEETIESLLNLGINHLEYEPFWKGKKIDYNTIDTAISPGMIHLCPEPIKNKIDIGPRTISASTFLKIITELNLDLEYLEKFTVYYNNLLLETSRRIAMMHEQSEMLRKNQEIILNEIDEGIISVDQNENIIIANEMATKLLKCDIGKNNRNFREIITRFKKIKLFTDDDRDNRISAIYSIHEKEILINKIPVVGTKDKNFIYTFKEISKLQALENTVRRKLAEKGYVAKYVFDDIWTKSEKVRRVKDKALKFAKTDKNTLIIGESGTGKELFAQAIHNESLRKNGPFVAVNFAALPENLVESELFGYEEGAFTGAKKGGKLGLFEQAHGGTIFLDEIGDAPLNVQTSLLRVLQERQIMRVGGDKLIPVDVRIIAATNKNLIESIKTNQFREDLYYRISVLPIKIPPLRQRKEDIIYFFTMFFKRHNMIKHFTPGAKKVILEYDFPGNVRELKNIADYLYVSKTNSDFIEVEDLPEHLIQNSHEMYKVVMDKTSFELNEQQLALNQIDIKDVFYILDLLFKNKNRGIGRYKMMSILKREIDHITEGYLRKTQRILRELNLVTIGKNKQGTRITEEGIFFLQYLQTIFWDNEHELY
ncbi:MAG: sigma 54-interacting transcriptional regulator [Tepidanaerobacteraceae bacterium]|nr:sigma 54-interacting transcriptional regulator [Tepidanaerobacteraceae bacterium]